jgi:ABC-2 type transport system permease protein
MDKIVAVARREFLATVRTRAFVLSVVLMPGIILGAMLGGEWVRKAGEAEKQAARRLAVVDHTGLVFPEFARQIATYNRERPNQPFELEQVPAESANVDALMRRVDGGDLYGYLIVMADATALDGPGCVMARKDSQFETGRRLEGMLNEAVFAVRCRQAGLDPQRVIELRREVPVRWADVRSGKQVSSNPVLNLVTPFAFMFLLWMGTFAISQGLLTTLIEEKSSRVVEVLLSAVSPTQLLAGKIVGMVAVGLLLLTVWGTVGFISAQRYQVAELVSGYRLTVALLYFVPGFLLFASLLAAIGSACNELKDAQGMVFPLSLLTIIPMIFWYYIAEHSDSLVSLVLSYIPPVTPFVMVLRVCANPHTPTWQVASTLAVLWVSVLVAVWAAGKVFRVGVLMYGKPPSLRELLRWVRYA